jgi:hypothetical protein
VAGASITRIAAADAVAVMRHSGNSVTNRRRRRLPRRALLGQALGHRSGAPRLTRRLTKRSGAALTTFDRRFAPLGIVRPENRRMHHTANLKVVPMRFALHQSPAMLAGLRSIATLARCACRPGYVGLYGGVHPARCWT